MCTFHQVNQILDTGTRLKHNTLMTLCCKPLIFFFAGILLGLILGQISAPSQLKNEQKLPKMVYINQNVLVLHFGENFTKIPTKIAKLQMNENLHKNVNENMFSFTFFVQIFMSF